MHSVSKQQIAAAFGIESVLVPLLPELCQFEVGEVRALPHLREDGLPPRPAETY